MTATERFGQLVTWLGPVLDAKGDVTITGSRRLTIGQSREMHVLDIEYVPLRDDVDTHSKVVVRIEQYGMLGTTSADEVATMRALRAAGFPVAEILGYEPSEDVLGQPFFVMAFVEGTSSPDLSTLDEYIEVLHSLHELDPDTAALHHLERPAPGTDAAVRQVERWYGIYRSSLLGEPSPLVEEAAQWLRNNAPESSRASVIHGDPGPGNYLHHEGRVSGLVDFEFSYLGDPLDDWAYLIAMRGAGAMSQPEWIERIERVVGVSIDPEELRYWKALTVFKGVCIDQTAARVYMQRLRPAPNLLVIATGIHLGTLKKLCDEILW